MEGLLACFAGLEDPRTRNAGRHDLSEILVIALCTVLCGGQYASDMARFSEACQGVVAIFTMGCTISPSCATWPSTSCARTKPKARCAQNSKMLPGTPITSSSSSHYFEMRLSWQFSPFQ
ncbi:MAG: transposase family protein [Methylovirgula sp.]